MYFEEIFNPIVKLWKTEFFLEYGNKKKSYIPSIGDDYNKVEDIAGCIWDEDDEGNLTLRKNDYNYWHSMLVFTMYGTLTDYGLYELNKGIKTLKLSDIPIEAFEKDFFKNLKGEDNEEYLENYLRKYKGLLNR